MDLKEELWLAGLLQGRTMRFRPRGRSMTPLLRDGDVVTIAPGKRCRIGDVVLFRIGEALILHRVVAKFSGRVGTKGDALGRLDATVTPRDILGRAIRRERCGKERSLESLEARLLGLALCLTISWVPKLVDILCAVRRVGREKLGLQGT